MLGGVHEFEQRATYFSSFRAKHIVAPLGMAKMSLTLHEPMLNAFCSKLQTTSKHAPKTYQTWKVLYAKQSTFNQKLC